MKMQPIESTSKTFHLLASAQTRQYLIATYHEFEANLSFVAQYPLGQVFVSSPSRSEDTIGGHELKRTKNIQKKPLPSPRRKEQ